MNEAIPEQNEGAQSNTEASADLKSEEEATHFYNLAKERLLHVNNWHEMAGTLSADFQLTDEAGHPVDREPKKSDHFRIDVPGPGPANGDGYDWVRVEEILHAEEGVEESVLIRVRPATSPVNREPGVAHFFSEEATSCFVVRRTGTRVTAAVFGRNERPNTNVEKLVDKARNTAVASGAVTAFSKLQWKSLVEGIVRL